MNEEQWEMATITIDGHTQVTPLRDHATGKPVPRMELAMSTATTPKTTAKHVGPGEAASKGRARQSKARVAANRDKIDAMNERMAANEPTRRELVGKAQALGIRGASGMRKDALLSAIAQAEAGVAEAMPPARGSTEPTPAKAAAKERLAKLDAMKAQATATPKAKSEPARATKGRTATNPRRAEALAEAKRLGKRGPGKKVTDDELRAYLRKVRAEHPGTTREVEAFYSYWVTKLAANKERIFKAWAELDAEIASAA